MSEKNDGPRPWKPTKWSDLPPKKVERSYTSDPAAARRQVEEAFTTEPRKPDFIDHVLDEVERQSFLTPEQKAGEKRLAELDAKGYAEVRLPSGQTTVVKKAEAQKMVNNYEISLEDILSARPVDPRLISGPEEGEWTDEDYGYEDDDEPEPNW